MGYGGEVQDGEWDHVCARRRPGLLVRCSETLAIKGGGMTVGVRDCEHPPVGPGGGGGDRG